MVESQTFKCQACNGDFEIFDKIPLILPCKHNICFVCGYEQYQRGKIITCSIQSCLQSFQVHPKKLDQDDELLNLIENQKKQLLKEKLEGQKVRVRQAQKCLIEKKATMIKILVEHFVNVILKDNITMQKSLNKMEKKLQYEIIMLETNKSQSQNLQKIQSTYESEQNIEKLLKNLQSIIKQNEDTSLQPYNEKNNMKDVIDSLESQILQLKYELKELKIKLNRQKKELQINEQNNKLIQKLKNLNIELQEELQEVNQLMYQELMENNEKMIRIRQKKLNRQKMPKKKLEQIIRQQDKLQQIIMPKEVRCFLSDNKFDETSKTYFKVTINKMPKKQEEQERMRYQS